jgi:phenylpropionate dioxygenase-like ring-hydroxylating dioxygenase large terminal subunit
MELPLQSRHGFLWVTARPQSPALDVAEWLGAVDADLTSFGLAQHRALKRNVLEPDCNWKLVIDAFLEGYHVKSLHRESVSRFFSDAVIFDLITPHCRSVGARKNLSELRESTRERWRLRDVSTVFYQLFPNTVLVFHPDWVSHILVTPLTVNQCRVEHTMLVAEDAPYEGKGMEHWERTFALIDGQVFQKEDLMIAQRVQAGLAGAAGDTFALGRLEQPIWHFHEQLGTAT